MKLLLLGFFSLFLASCCGPRCGVPYCLQGADEFVIDSYCLRGGKFSILEMEGDCYPCLDPSYLIEYQDIVDENDTLKIAVVNPTRSDLTASVNAVGQTVGYRVINGSIKLPSLPPIFVKGLTLLETRDKIQSLYNLEVSSTEVFIDYLTRLHSKVELAGAVAVPEIAVNGKMRLYEVLALAHVPTNANYFKSYVLRNNHLIAVDMYKLMIEGDMSQNIVMRPGDKVFIADPMAATVMVMGEVGAPQIIPVNGTISLREALAAAGGIPYTGDKRCIQVIRGNIINPKIYRLSWNHITYLPNDSLLLMPGDTVFVSENPITSWNRFIDQLLPSALLIDLGNRAWGICH